MSSFVLSRVRCNHDKRALVLDLACHHPPLRNARAGSGPAGMYTARTLLRKAGDVEVDIIEKLPTPFGLVRYGLLFSSVWRTASCVHQTH